MPLIYWASQYIPSGLISVLFGLSPFFVALLAAVLLGDRSLGGRHYLALILALGSSLLTGTGLILAGLALFNAGKVSA